MISWIDIEKLQQHIDGAWEGQIKLNPLISVSYVDHVNDPDAFCDMACEFSLDDTKPHPDGLLEDRVYVMASGFIQELAYSRMNNGTLVVRRKPTLYVVDTLATGTKALRFLTQIDVESSALASRYKRLRKDRWAIRNELA